MRKVLIYTCLIASLVSGCAPSESKWVHRINIQQGNVVTQDMVDQLQPGMSRRQVQYIMGTPLLQDAFHREQWTYYYAFQPGRGEREEHKVTLHFAEDSLARIEGDLRPGGGDPSEKSQPRNISVTVPDVPQERYGILSRFWHWLTLKKKREEGVDIPSPL